MSFKYFTKEHAKQQLFFKMPKKYLIKTVDKVMTDAYNESVR
jgi:hypothetical protein